MIGVGMLIDVRIMFGDINTLWIILVMVITGALSKLLAAAAMAWWSGEDRNAMWLMFGLTNAHAAGALAIVMIGTHPNVNLMNDQVLNGTVMLILFRPLRRDRHRLVIGLLSTKTISICQVLGVEAHM